MARPSNRTGIDRADQGIVRVSKDTLTILKRIANNEQTTMIDLAETVFRNFIAKYSQHDASVLNKTSVMPLILTEDKTPKAARRKPR